MPHITIRLPQETLDKIAELAADAGFENRTAFIRQAINNECTHNAGVLGAFEARIMAQLTQLEARDEQQLQAIIALLASTAKMMIAWKHGETPAAKEEYRQLEARAARAIGSNGKAHAKEAAQ